MESRSLPPAEPGVPHHAATDRGVHAEPASAPAADASALDDPRTLQILSTEHWSLLATRSLVWSESFSRTGLFLSVLSAGAVALGLVGGAVGFNSEFTAFALALLPVILFVGVATFVRIDEVNNEDAYWVAALNRIRHAYLEVRPGLEPYFTAGWTDDVVGMARTFAMTRTPTPLNTFIHLFVTTPGMVAVIDGALAAAIAGIAAAAFVGPGMTGTIPVALVIGVGTTALLLYSSVLRGRRVTASWETRFPMDPSSPGPGAYWAGVSGGDHRAKDGGREPRS